MLTDKEYLLLCEIASNGVLSTNQASIGEIAKLLISEDKCDNRELIEEVSLSSNLEVLKLKDSKKIYNLKVFILQDLFQNDFVVFVGENNFEGTNNKCFEEIFDYVRQKIDLKKCYLTGLKIGGIYAAYIASRLEVQAVVFGMPCLEELTENVINFVAENEPVGEYLKNVVFVKQKTIDESVDKTYFDILVFDENGKAVEGEQTEYSKFCSWFYNNVSVIDNRVWEMFFNSASEDEELIDKDIYSLFLRFSELNEERIKVSLKNVVKYIENELEKNIKTMKSELEKTIFNIDEQNFNDRICEISENASQNATDIVKSNYRSVETILMGVELFSLGSRAVDNTRLMEQFCENIDNILHKEELRLIDILKSGQEHYLEMLPSFPEFEYNND